MRTTLVAIACLMLAACGLAGFGPFKIVIYVNLPPQKSQEQFLAEITSIVQSHGMRTNYGRSVQTPPTHVIEARGSSVRSWIQNMPTDMGGADPRSFVMSFDPWWPFWGDRYKAVFTDVRADLLARGYSVQIKTMPAPNG